MRPPQPPRRETCQSLKTMIALTVNGKHWTIDREMTLLQFLQERGVNPLAVAVEYNGEIVRRERYGEVVLKEGDRLEIVHMVGGG